jgi:Cof subfamily protein (haloacid dehalogenase superfamily)
MCMIVSDLDGTLLQDDRTFSRTDIETLNRLGTEGVLRVIATGRSFYSARTVVPDDFPIDYLIISSGAGIVDWDTKHIVCTYSLSPDEVETAALVLMESGADFMIHEPIPNNHFYFCHSSGKHNPDFYSRIELYRDFQKKRKPGDPLYREACQLLAVEPWSEDGTGYSFYAKKLYPLKVIRTTSPIDHRSTWIEIFPSQVSKARASETIGRLHGIDRTRVLAIGNDYNDVELLVWAQRGVVVENAPEDLKSVFPTVRSNNEAGFSEAVELYTPVE